MLSIVLIYSSGCTINAQMLSMLRPRTKVSLDVDVVPPYVNSSNESAITIAGECPESATQIKVESPFDQTFDCKEGLFSGALDFRFLQDDVYQIIMTPDVGEPFTWEILKDTVKPSVSILGVVGYINLYNVTSYSVFGNCDENGQFVYVQIGILDVPVVCVGGSYSGSFDFSAVADGIVNLQVRHSDQAGNANSASDSRLKDTAEPGNAELTGAPVGATPQVSLDIIVSGPDVVNYAYKVGPASSTNCSIETGYSDFLSVANHIVESILNFTDGTIRLCVRTEDIAKNRQSLPHVVQHDWVKDSTIALATLSGFMPPGVVSNSGSDRTVFVGGLNITHYKAVTVFNQPCSTADFSSVPEVAVSTDFSFSITADGDYRVCAIGKNIAEHWQLSTAATMSSVLTIDRIQPSLTLSSTDVDPFSSASFQVMAEFSESVAEFTSGDVNVTNGTVSEFVGSGSTYTFTVTPNGQGPVVVATNAGVAQDRAGNSNLAAISLTRTYDSVAPTATITSVGSNVNGPFTATLSFSEPVVGVSTTDFVVANALLTDLVGGGNLYTVTVIPTVDGPVSVSYGAGLAADAAGNGNSASATLSVNYDSLLPGVTLSSVSADPFNTTSFSVTAIFSEDVTGFTLGEVSVTNGTASSLSGFGTTYTFTVTPSAQGLVTVSLGAGVAQDSAGNNNTSAVSLARTYDSAPPSATLSSSAPSSFDSANINVTVTFSESVTGLDLGEIVVTNGTASSLSGAGTTYTLTVTPSGQGLVTVALGAGAAQDAAGNNNTAAANLIRTYDSIQPTVSLSSVASDPFNSGNFSVTATFSEDVTGLTLDEIGVINGTASSLNGVGTTYTFIVTPTAQGLVTVKLGAAIVQDAAGNYNSAAIDLVRTYDSVGAIITGISSDATWRTSKTWNWGCNETCTYRYVIDTNAGTIPGGAYGSTISASLSSGSGVFYLHLEAQDQAGNLTLSHVSVSLDNTNPTAPGGVVDGTTLSSLTESPIITFSSGTDGHSGVQKHQLRVLRVSDSVVMKDWHDFTSGSAVTGLSLATNMSYKVEVKAIDNVNLASTFGVSDGWVADISGPSAPSGLSTGSVPFSLSLSPALTWSSASDGGGSGVASYQAIVYRTSDNAPMSSWTPLASGSSITGLSLTGGVQYYFKVRAVDSAGNIGTESAASGSWTASSAYLFNYTISANTSYFNVKAQAIAAGWDQVAPLAATITVNAEIYVWSDSTGTPAFDTGSGLPAGSTLTLINNGKIIGKGGQGGGVNTAGSPGGVAMNITIPATINSTSGYIAGGGGGGGGSANGSGGGGAGGGAGGVFGSAAGGIGGSLGVKGGNGGFEDYSGWQDEHGCGCSWWTYTGAGGGGGRILPGSGGSGGSNAAGGFGGGAGGGGGGYYDDYGSLISTVGGVGGAGPSVGGLRTGTAGYGGGGGGGWGASGGASGNGKAGGAGGKAINTNSNSVTWSGGSQPSNIYGAVN